MKSRSGSLNNIRGGLLVLGLAFFIWGGLWSPSAGFCAGLEDPGEGTGDGGHNPASFGELLEGFAEMSGLEARFEEEKFLALLAAPLRSSGRMYFAPPSTLLRRVETPRRQDILIQADQVRISSGESGESNGNGQGPNVQGDVQRIDLAGRGGIRPLVESMIWIFTGDRASLERVYNVDYQQFIEADGGGDKGPEPSNRWQVRLTPKSAPLSGLIRELLVRGRGPGADTMELVETSGDRTVTHILDADPRREFSPAERLDLFGAGD